MFDIYNLDPVDFEKFCCDYIERITGKTFKYYAVGRDGGIDLQSVDGEIICQCKRYSNSTSITNKILKEELTKIQKINPIPKQYYFFTTKSLTPQMTHKIYNFFHNYMKDLSYVISKKDINKFLDDKKNIDVLKKHHKLWLTSTNILSLYLNKYLQSTSKIEIQKAKEEEKYFVDTKPYYDAIDLIEKKSVVLLTGDPGVGKSITSRMIIRYLLATYKEYEFKSIPSNHIDKLIESIDDDKKEIILLDDFLGQTCENINLHYLKELELLFRLLKNNNNKKVILNSRVTIFNKVKNENTEFSKVLDDIHLDEYRIDVSDISTLDRARILYNLLHINKIPFVEFLTIKDNKNYIKIINHSSFNIRIIEYSILKYKNNSHLKLLKLIIKNLDNPYDVWDDEFNKIEEIDKIVMYQLYSLGDNYIPLVELNKSVTNYLEKCTSYSTNNFKKAIDRLNKSLLSINIIGNTQYIKVLNPSINDYIQNKILNDELLQHRIVDNSIYVEQIAKMTRLNPILIDRVNNLFSLNAYKFANEECNNKVSKLLHLFYTLNYKNEKYKSELKKIFDNKLDNTIMFYFLINDSLRNFYELNYVLLNLDSCVPLFDFLKYDDILKLVRYYNFETDISNKDISEKFDSFIIDAVENYLIDKCENDLFYYIHNNSINDKYEVNGDEELKIIPSFAEEIENEINNNYISYLNEVINDFADYEYEIIPDMISKDNVIFSINKDDLIDSDMFDSISYFFKDNNKQKEKTINEDDIFNQEYTI